MVEIITNTDWWYALQMFGYGVSAFVVYIGFIQGLINLADDITKVDGGTSV